MPLPTYESTLTFRRFRIRHTEVSRLYWAVKLAFEIELEKLKELPDADYVIDALTPSPSFPRSMYPLTVADTKAEVDSYTSRFRLRLLVTCSANLESYLKDITFLFLSAKGHTTDHVNLDPVGSAIGRPILGNASLIEPLVYAESLFGVTFGMPLKKWKRFYKIRCAVAHSGGFVTPRMIKELGEPSLTLHEPLRLSYQELFDAMQAADQIVEILDRKLVSHDLKKAEIARELTYLKETNKLPARKHALKFIHEEFGYPRVGKDIANFVYSEFYKKVKQ